MSTRTNMRKKRWKIKRKEENECLICAVSIRQTLARSRASVAWSVELRLDDRKVQCSIPDTAPGFTFYFFTVRCR